MEIFDLKEKYPCDAKEEADKILEECDDICKELDFELCLLMGTCLGIIRDGKYIKDDNDIDIGVKCSNSELEKFIERLIRTGYTRDGISSHFYKYGILVDLFQILEEYASFFVSFDKVAYNGRIYNVPHPIEVYLENWYGDWSVSKPKNLLNIY